MGGESPADYRSLFDSMDEGFCMIRLLPDEHAIPEDYVFLDVNGSYKRQTGIQAAKGKRISEIAPVIEEPRLEMYGEVARTGESRRFDYASPEGRWYEGVAYRVGVAEDRTVAIVLRDMTERKRREQELEGMNQTLQARVATGAEEVRHCQEQLRAMTIDLTLAEQRERKRLATELHEDLAERLLLARLKLGQIHQHGMLDEPSEQLLKEADTVLTRALLYTHTIVGDLSPLVLQDLGLQAAVKWLAERMELQGLAVTLQTTVTAQLALPESHAVFLFQSVRELLMNVLKHAKCRGASILMTMQAGQLQIEVQDEGVGFEPANPSIRPSQFGLASIAERITVLGGTFEVDSRLQEGTKATLKLPIGQAAHQATPSDTDRSNVSQETSRKIPGGIIRVLLVDDHAMVRQGLKSVLDAYADIKVVGEAAEGEAAVRLASELLPTVVLMDINMPGCNGIEATQRIKAQYPDIRVIGLSVDADGHNQGAMLNAGAYSLMTKEAAVEQLYSMIYEAVKPGVTPFTPLR